MADDATDTFLGGFRNYLGAIAFILPLVGVEQLVQDHPVLPWWGSATLIALGLPIYFAPAIWVYLGAREETENPLNDLRDGLRVAGTHASTVSRDTGLQDAVAFALYGHWPEENEQIFGGEDDLARMGSAIQRMRELAHEGKLIIWGRTNPNTLHVPIKPEFWVNHQIGLMSMWGPPDTPRTEPATRSNEAEYQALMVSSVQIEIFWPPRPIKTHKASGGIVSSLSTNVTRVNQPVRDAARLAFEAIQGNQSERIISGLHLTPEDRLNFFIADMAGQGLRHYGKKPPSTVAMEIPLAERISLHPVEGENSLVDTFDHQPTYVDVTVNGDDLRTYLDKLRARYP